jgi:Ca2+-binding EF-hand superfamily protein
MDEAGIGKVSFRGLQSFASKFGGQTLSEEELGKIFSDFNPSASSEHMISREEFLTFFSKVSTTINNRAFSDLISDLLL